MRYIALSKNKYALIDDEDLEIISKYKWYFDGRYARNKLGYMHRFIMNYPKNYQVDHINGNKLDNRKENLRLATSSQNHVNSLKNIGLSNFKGVRKQAGRNKWRVDIQYNKKKIYIGNFENKKEAAMTYNYFAREIYGEFAYLNKVF